MKKVFTLVFLAATIASISGCATIISGKTQKINVVTSSGKKIKAAIDGIPFDAPGIVEVHRKNSDKIISTRDPRCNETTLAPKTVDPIFFINIFIGGVFGSTTDYATESMWKYQDTVTITCQN
ncbi:MAG: adenosine deaminase [Deltaproteobacteria bacterium]|nr:adenosine deaminase [Deltaproteobacteria bacterium]